MRFNTYITKIPAGISEEDLRYFLKNNLAPSCEVEPVHDLLGNLLSPGLSPEFRTESPVTVRERLGSGGIPTAPPIPCKNKPEAKDEPT